MSESADEFLSNVAAESERRMQAMDRLMASAEASKVFGQPVISGQHTIITASEVVGGWGFGSGMGYGGPTSPEDEGSKRGGPAGAGGGGGGGGGSMGRPVAAIVVSADGVQVKPVLDLTKIGLAALTAFGAMGILALKMRKKR